MKPVAVVVAIALVGLGTLSTCSVNRHSSEFACTTDGDCADNTRTCDRGYCVERTDDCPSPCTSCDLNNMTCEINCSTGRPCGSVQCPLGFDCTIRCSNANACGTIDCAQGASCDITCTGAMACGSVNCGFGQCSVDCTGPSSCPTIDCVTSCACDVRCNNAMACQSLSCPPGLPLCTRGGVSGATCDSSEAGCDRCP